MLSSTDLLSSFYNPPSPSSPSNNSFYIPLIFAIKFLLKARILHSSHHRVNIDLHLFVHLRHGCTSLIITFFLSPFTFIACISESDCSSPPFFLSSRPLSCSWLSSFDLFWRAWFLKTIDYEFYFVIVPFGFQILTQQCPTNQSVCLHEN